MKPSGGKTRGSHVACRECRGTAERAAVYCPHQRALEAWIGGARVVIVNAGTREQALRLLRRVRAQLRREESDEIIFTCKLRFRDDAGGTTGEAARSRGCRSVTS